MGRMHIENEGRVIGDYGRDSRAFGHHIENLRDSLLNGAKRVEFGIMSLPREDDGKGVLRPTAGPHVLRRIIADNGNGMDETKLRDVYSKLSVSGTECDFAVTVNPDGTTNVALEEYETDDVYNARRGFGGRGTLYRFNKMGVVTITIHEGEARLVWMYADVEGNPRLRDFLETDDSGIVRKTSIVRPYTEPDVLTREELASDLPYAVQLLVRTGLADTAEDAEKFVRTMSATAEIDNPYAGIEWDDNIWDDGGVIPEWVVARWDDETGLAYGPDKALAHGTVKALMGNSVTDSTAVSGDPFYDVESQFTRVNGVGNQFWADLSHWDVRVHAVRPSREGRKGEFQVVGHPGTWMLDMDEGRVQDGAITRRTKVTRTEKDAGVDSPNAWQGVLDLGEYGKAVVLLRHHNDTLKIASTAGADLWASTRGGVVGMVYGLEMHGLYSTDRMTAGKGALINMGFPVYSKGQDDRVSVFFFPPRIKVAADGHTILQHGVHQTSARDRIKWNGGDLPLGGDTGLFRAVAKALREQAPALLEILQSENDAGSTAEVDVKDMPELMTHLAEFVKMAETSRTATSDKAALIADTSGEHKGEPIGPQGKPGLTERPLCELCGKKVHDEDCPNKPKSHDGGGGGTTGTNEKLEAVTNGKRRGRTSRARGKSATEAEKDVEVPKETPPRPPSVLIQKQDDYAGPPDSPAYWGAPNPILPLTGTIYVNRDHVSYMAIEGYVLHTVKKREKVGTQLHTEQWVKDRLAETLLAYLALKDKELTPEAGAKSVDELAEWITGDDDDTATSLFWIAAFNAMFSARASLRSYVVAKTAADEAA